MTGILDIGSEIDKVDLAATPESGQNISSRLAALLHERQHWLQYVGTTSGIFLTLLLRLQSTVIAENADLAAITPVQLPLRDSFSTDHVLIQKWGRIECTRRIFYGTRPGDVQDLWDKDLRPQFAWLSREIGDLVRIWFAQTPAEEVADAWWPPGWPASLPSKVKLRWPTGSAWIAGARHVMECGARVNEVLKYGTHAWDGRARYEELSVFFGGGEYGLARDLFYSFHGEPTIGKELALACLCDISLGSFVPPVSRLMPTLVDADLWSPFFLFAHCVGGLRGFDFRRDWDLAEPDSIDEFARSVKAHLLRSAVGLPLYMAENLTAALFDQLDAAVRPGDYYQLVENRLPLATGPASSDRYLLACYARARGIRRQHPGFLALPVSWYLRDRAVFHELFDQVIPPLTRYVPQGIGPARNEPGWFEFFLGAAIQHEIARSVMSCDVSELGRILRSLTDTLAGPEYRELMTNYALGGCFGTELMDSLLAEVRQASPAPEHDECLSRRSGHLGPPICMDCGADRSLRSPELAFPQAPAAKH